MFRVYFVFWGGDMDYISFILIEKKSVQVVVVPCLSEFGTQGICKILWTDLHTFQVGFVICESISFSVCVQFLGTFLQDVLLVIWLTFLKMDLLCTWNVTMPASQWGESLHQNNSFPLGDTESILRCRNVFIINHIFHSFLLRWSQCVT